jgi:hypothetical protein
MAQDIARRRLKDICTAFDITEQVSDPEVFKFKPAKVRIGIQSDKNGQFDDQNRIKRVSSLTEAESTEPPPAKTAAKPVTKPVSSKPTGGPGAAPWKRSAA